MKQISVLKNLHTIYSSGLYGPREYGRLKCATQSRRGKGRRRGGCKHKCKGTEVSFAFCTKTWWIFAELCVWKMKGQSLMATSISLTYPKSLFIFLCFILVIFNRFKSIFWIIRSPRGSASAHIKKQSKKMFSICEFVFLLVWLVLGFFPKEKKNIIFNRKNTKRKLEVEIRGLCS